jgi:hypothetical protein
MARLISSAVSSAPVSSDCRTLLGIESGLRTATRLREWLSLRRIKCVAVSMQVFHCSSVRAPEAMASSMVLMLAGRPREKRLQAS